MIFSRSFSGSYLRINFEFGDAIVFCVFGAWWLEGIKSGMFFAISLSPELVLHQTQMDSFTYINPTEVPSDNETGGSGGNSYCVVAQSAPVENPTNMEGGGGGTGIAYCVVA